MKYCIDVEKITRIIEWRLNIIQFQQERVEYLNEYLKEVKKPGFKSNDCLRIKKGRKRYV